MIASDQNDGEHQWSCPECFTIHKGSPEMMNDCCLEHLLDTMFLSEAYEEKKIDLHKTIVDAKSHIANVYGIDSSRVEFLFGKDSKDDGFRIK